MANKSFWDRLIEILPQRSRPRAPDYPQLIALKAEQVTDDKVHELQVVISSPLQSLEEPRAFTDQLIRRLPGARASLFEFDPRTGRCILDACENLIKRADIVVILIGQNIGTIDPNIQTTYSGFEHELLVERQREAGSSGRPRVYVYLHQVTRDLQEWEKTLRHAYGVIVEDDPEELAYRIAFDVSDALLDERQQQVAALHTDAKRREMECKDTRLALESRVSSLHYQIQTASQLHDVEREATHRTLERYRQDEETREARVTDAVAARELVVRARIRDLALFAIASIALAVVFVLLGAWIASSGLGSPAAGGLATLLHRQNETLEHAAESLDDLVSHLTTPAEDLHAKSDLAKALNPGFDCSFYNENDWTVPAAPEIRFSRREVCETSGALVLRILADGGKCESRLLSEPTAKKVVSALQAAGARIQHVQIIGHASQEEITADCGSVEDGWPPMPRSIAAEDRKIRNNTQLAWARAASAAKVLRDADKTLPLATPSIGALGVLAAATSNGSNGEPRLHRRIDIEIRALPKKNL